jgi:serine kinase of HPr protein (carbohydrate metabolism regulator)
VTQDTVHATAVTLGGAGVLIRGESGAGKSTLALLLLDRAITLALPATLVGDDRVCLAREDDALLARPHPALGGTIEVRGLGLCPVVAAVASARIHLVVDLVARAPRLPEAPAPADLLGCAVPRLVLDRRLLRTGLGPRLVLDALAGVTGGPHPAVLALPAPSRP